MAQRNIAVFHPGYDKILYYTHREEAHSLVHQGSADWHAGGHIRLVETGIPHPCRTRISSGGPFAAMGLSQVYTTRGNNGRVDGNKTIYREDRCVFHTATLECMSAAT